MRDGRREEAPQPVEVRERRRRGREELRERDRVRGASKRRASFRAVVNHERANRDASESNHRDVDGDDGLLVASSADGSYRVPGDAALARGLKRRSLDRGGRRP